MRQHHGDDEEQGDFLELAVEKSLAERVLDDILKRRITEGQKERHVCDVFLHLVLLENLVVIQADDSPVPVKSYSLVKTFPELLHGAGDVLSYRGQQTSLQNRRAGELGPTRYQVSGVLGPLC